MNCRAPDTNPDTNTKRGARVHMNLPTPVKAGKGKQISTAADVLESLSEEQLKTLGAQGVDRDESAGAEFHPVRGTRGSRVLSDLHGKIIAADYFLPGEDDGALHRIAQLPQIAGPAVTQNRLDGLLGEAFEASEHEMMLSLQSDDFKEGVAHFLEKRAPVFTGKSRYRFSIANSRVTSCFTSGGFLSVNTIWSTLMCPQPPFAASTI